MSLRGGALITSPFNRPRMRVPETPPLSPISHARVGFSFGIRRGLATGKRKGRAAMSMQSVTASSHPTLSYTDSLAASTSDTLLLIARILMGWIFVRSGLGKLMDINAFTATMPGRGLPGWLGYVAAPVEFFGGIALVLGLATRYVAVLLLLFVIIATFSSHRYWEFAEAAARRAQDNNFYKNLAMMGGLVFAFVTAGGRFSIDRLLARK
jgi:putative oxidoreductase